MEEALKDERFQHILSDPRFRRMPKNVRKIKVDERFKQMFKDKKFKEKCALDMRGRPIDITPSENLKKLYNFTSESSEDDDELIGHEDASESNEIKSNQDKKPKKGKLKIKKPNSDKTMVIKKEVEFYENSDSDSKMINQNDNRLQSKKAKKVNKHLQEDTSKSKSKLNEEKEFSENSNIEISVSEEAKMKRSKSQLLPEEASENKSKNLKVKKSLQDSYESLVKESEESESSERGTSESESEETDDSESEGSANTNEFDHRWEELREDAPDTDEITRRLAVCNMDWDRIRAEDLFAVFDSFKPADGCINSVKIYPSEYGMKRMEEEKLHGPPELVEEVLDPDEEEVEDKKTSKYHREKLRQYQINRLKYYYAVIDCDCPHTANTLYEQLNGMEYESSSVRFDIRFIPDDVTFDFEPTSVADKIPDPTEYKPRLFVTTALQQVKVNLTWDETDPKRRETLQKAFTEPDSIERDIKDYLASSSSESEEEVNEDGEEENENNKLSINDRIAKYKALLQSLEEKEKQDENKYEMEITWEPGLKEKTEEIVKEKIEKDSLNPFEEMLKKKKEDRKLRKKEKKISNNEVMDKDHSASEGSDEEFFSKKKSVAGKTEGQDVKKLDELSLLSDSRKKDIIVEKGSKKEKKRSKIDESEDFKCDVNDPRFSAIYTSHLFNIDPSDPHFKKTEGNLALIQEKQKKLKYKDSYNDNQRNAKKSKYF